MSESKPENNLVVLSRVIYEKPGWKTRICLLLVSLLFIFTYELWSDSDIEWHLFSKYSPIIIPDIIIQSIFWVGAPSAVIGFIVTLILSILPRLQIIIYDRGIGIPNVFTRKYKITNWSEIEKIYEYDISFNLVNLTQLLIVIQTHDGKEITVQNSFFSIENYEILKKQLEQKLDKKIIKYNKHNKPK